MKSFEDLQDVRKEIVASFAEAWIEINVSHKLLYEILPSPPSRRRGLKSKVWRHLYNGNAVASFAEAWIEIEFNALNSV